MVDKSVVAAVRTHAHDHYNEDGWDFVIECMSDDDLAQEIDSLVRDNDVLKLGLALDGSVADAIKAVHWLVKLWDDRRKDVESTRW
jgi:hypothetical protein